VTSDLLEFPDIVAEEDVGDLVGDVAVGTTGIVVGVAYDDGSAVGKVECGGGERAGLKLVEFLEFGSVDEIVCGVDLDVEVRCEAADRHVRVGLEPELGTCAVGESFGLGLESSSHGRSRSASGGGRIGELALHLFEQPGELA
jgi:hypothetical protein